MAMCPSMGSSFKNTLCKRKEYNTAATSEEQTKLLTCQLYILPRPQTRGGGGLERWNDTWYRKEEKTHDKQIKKGKHQTTQLFKKVPHNRGAATCVIIYHYKWSTVALHRGIGIHHVVQMEKCLVGKHPCKNQILFSQNKKNHDSSQIIFFCILFRQREKYEAMFQEKW